MNNDHSEQNERLAQGDPVESGPSSVVAARATGLLERLSRILVPLVCLEVGLVLLILPWWSSFWGNNLFAGVPVLAGVWPNGFFRGAISGLGLVNLWIGIQEAYLFWKNW